MDVIQNELSTPYVTNKYGSQYRYIKDLIINFEYTQQYRISNKQKKLVESNNKHHISRWACAHLHCQLGQQSYTDWEIQYACIARIILKYTYPVILRNMEFLSHP